MAIWNDETRNNDIMRWIALNFPPCSIYQILNKYGANPAISRKTLGVYLLEYSEAWAFVKILLVDLNNLSKFPLSEIYTVQYKNNYCFSLMRRGNALVHSLWNFIVDPWTFHTSISQFASPLRLFRQ